jgi:hypothetical protein
VVVRCRIEFARRLRQDAAVEGGSHLERNACLDQKDALHVRTCAHLDLARDLPEDVFRLCTARQDHIIVRSCKQVARDLNDEDVVGTAIEGDVTLDYDV